MALRMASDRPRAGWLARAPAETTTGANSDLGVRVLICDIPDATDPDQRGSVPRIIVSAYFVGPIPDNLVRFAASRREANGPSIWWGPGS